MDSAAHRFIPLGFVVGGLDSLWLARTIGGIIDEKIFDFSVISTAQSTVIPAVLLPSKILFFF